MRSRWFLVAGCILLAAACSAGARAAGKGACPIFPVPKEYKVRDGRPVALTGPVAVVVGGKAAEPEKYAASRLTYVLKKRFGLDAPVVTERAVPKKATNLLILGTLESNALLKSLKEKHGVKLDSLKGKDPMQDAFAIESLKTDDRRVVLMIGTTARSVIYAQYAFLEAVTRRGRDVVHPDMSVRDWSSLRYRDWWPGYLPPDGKSLYTDPDVLDQVSYARANMTQFRTFHNERVSEDVVKECWRRGIRPYGMVNGAIDADDHARSVAEARAWLKKGCYGIFVTFDDAGMGEDPEGLCNKVTAVIKKRFGAVGDRIATVAGGDYGYLDTYNNRRMRKFRDFEKAIFYITHAFGGPQGTRTHLLHSRKLDIPNFIWWHNYPMGLRSFYAPIRAHRYYALVPINQNCWGPFSIDGLRQADKHIPGISAQNEDFDFVPLQLFWAWDPPHYGHHRACTTIYRQRHGAAAVEAARQLDADMYALGGYYNLMWRNWAFRAWTLKDVSKRAEALALIARMEKLNVLIKAGKKVTYLSDKGYDRRYTQAIAAHLNAAKRLATIDFPEHMVVRREGRHPKGAVVSLKLRMLGLLWAGKERKAQEYMAGLKKEVLPALEVVEKKLADSWYTKEYAEAWRKRLDLAYWQRVATQSFADKFSLRIGRNAKGLVVMRTSAPNCDILFTLDGPPPAVGAAEVYGGPRSIPQSCVIRAMARQRATGLLSRVFEQRLGVEKTDWKVIHADSERGTDPAVHAIDGKRETLWMTEREKDKPPHPHEISIDLGRETGVHSIGIYPRPHNGRGVPRRYRVYASADGKRWGEPVAAGQFGSIEDCMIIVLNKRTKTRFLRLVFLKAWRSVHFSVIAELDVFDFAPRPAVGPKGNVRP